VGANDQRGAVPSVFTSKALVQPICCATLLKDRGSADPSYFHQSEAPTSADLPLPELFYDFGSMYRSMQSC
jgi:hypothetical protein